MELCLTAVKFARKKGNITLASRLLRQFSDTQTQEEEQEEHLCKAFRRLNLEGTLGEKWGPEVEIEKAKVLRAAGEETSTLFYLTLHWVGEKLCECTHTRVYLYPCGDISLQGSQNLNISARR